MHGWNGVWTTIYKVLKSFVVNIQDKSKKEINFTELIKILMKNISNLENYFALQVN